MSNECFGLTLSYVGDTHYSLLRVLVAKMDWFDFSDRSNPFCSFVKVLVCFDRLRFGHLESGGLWSNFGAD